MEISHLKNGIDLEKLKTKSVFISYGHDDFLPYAKRLAKDLSEFVRKVWFDEFCIRSAHKWDAEIEKGIRECDSMIAMMTRHAYRRPTGVCLNEVVYASNNGKEIVPVLVERISIPLLLCSVQYVDVCEIYDPQSGKFDEEKYYDTLKRLLICIENPDREADGHLSALKKFLMPIDNQPDIAEKTRGFVGREWLLEKYQGWLADEDAPTVYFLMGGPGTGKSCFSAHLSMVSEQVKGIHFCKYNDKHSASFKTVVKTLAYHLAAQLEQYGDYLENVDMEKVVNAGDAELFSMLLLAPLGSIAAPEEKIVLIIDALDEMNDEGLDSFISLLESYYHSFPKWFRLVLTSRNNPSILNRLRTIRPFVIDTESEENKQDIRTYLNEKLSGVMELTEEQVEKVVEKSQGVFQYVTFLVQQICRSGCTDFESVVLPEGLRAAYRCDFARCFAIKDDYQRVLPVLEVMCAAQEPLATGDFRRILQDPYLLKNTVSLLGDYVVNRGGCISFFHKSIRDWLTDEFENPDYYVDTYSGHEKLSRFAEDHFEADDYHSYVYKYGFYHMYMAESYESIYSLLNEQEDAFNDSFCAFLSHLLITGQPTRKLFRGMKRSVRQIDCIVCRIIRSFYEKGENERFITQMADAFADAIPWLGQYTEFYGCLMESRLQRLPELGQSLIPQVENKEIRLGIYNYMGDSYRLLGDHENAFANYQKVIDGYPEHMWADKCFDSLYNYYDLRYVKGYLKQAEQSIDKLGRQLPEMAFCRYKMWRLKGNIHYQAGRRSQSVQCFENSLAVAEHHHRRLYVAEAHYSIAEALVGSDNERAWQHVETAREIADKIHSATAYSRTYFAAVELLCNEEKWQDAVREGLVGIELVSKTGYMTGAARIMCQVANAYYRLGEYDKAMEYALYPLQRFKARNSYPRWRLFAYRTLLAAACRAGRLCEVKGLDDPKDIPNLSEFDNLDGDIAVIEAYLKEDENDDKTGGV